MRSGGGGNRRRVDRRDDPAWWEAWDAVPSVKEAIQHLEEAESVLLETHPYHMPQEVGDRLHKLRKSVTGAARGLARWVDDVGTEDR
jgi:hypothetical protein